MRPSKPPPRAASSACGSRGGARRPGRHASTSPSRPGATAGGGYEERHGAGNLAMLLDVSEVYRRSPSADGVTESQRASYSRQLCAEPLPPRFLEAAATPLPPGLGPGPSVLDRSPGPRVFLAKVAGPQHSYALGPQSNDLATKSEQTDRMPKA